MVPTDMDKVNQTDAEDCRMCAEIESEPCAFHQGFYAGVAYTAEVMDSALDDA